MQLSSTPVTGETEYEYRQPYESVEHLFSLLEERKIEYLLAGGIALLKYVEGRNTEDIHLIMALGSLRNLPEIEIASENDDFVGGANTDRAGEKSQDCECKSQGRSIKTRDVHSGGIETLERQSKAAR